MTLEKHHVTSRPYHGGAFTGNHCHKYVSSKVYARLTDEIVRQAKLYTTDSVIIDEAELIKALFNDINECFYNVHTSLSHTKRIHPQTIPEIQQHIDTYIRKFE